MKDHRIPSASVQWSALRVAVQKIIGSLVQAFGPLRERSFNIGFAILNEGGFIDFGDGHTGVDQFLIIFVRDG